MADSAAATARVDPGDLLAQPFDRGALDVQALAQLFDLPLGRENAPRFGASAAFDPVRSAVDDAVQRGDRAVDQAGGRPRLLRGFGNPRVGEARRDRRFRRA